MKASFIINLAACLALTLASGSAAEKPANAGAKQIVPTTTTIEALKAQVADAKLNKLGAEKAPTGAAAKRITLNEANVEALRAQLAGVKLTKR